MKLFLAALCFLLPLKSEAAVTDWQSNKHGRVRLVSAVDQLPLSAQTFYLGLQFQPIQDWHVYWINAGDAGYPPKLNWKGSSGIGPTTFLWPAPHRFDLPGNLVAYGYERDVVYPIEVRSTGQAAKIRLVVDYLTCSESCVPYKMTFTLDIPSGSALKVDSETSSSIESFRAQIPQPLSAWPALQSSAHLWDTPAQAFFESRLTAPVAADRWEVFFEEHAQLAFGRSRFAAHEMAIQLQAPIDFKPEKPKKADPVSYTVVGYQKDKVVFAVTDRVSLPWQTDNAPAFISEIKPLHTSPGQSRSLPLMLLLALVGGLILNVMPCVLPVLSIKIFSLLKQQGLGRGVVARNSLISASGVLVSFWILAAAAVIAKRVGQSVGWGIQFQEPLFVAGLGWIVVLFALNLWGLFEIQLPAFLNRVASKGSQEEGAAGYFFSGFFSTILATPCSAPFLGAAIGFALSQPGPMVFAIFTFVALGMSLPYFAVALFPGALSWFPKPGAWMQSVKVFCGFLMAATAVWLSFVLSSQISSVGLAFYHLAWVVLALLIWIPYARQRSWGWITWALVAGLTVAALHQVHVSRQSQSTHQTSFTERIAWQPFEPERIPGLLQSGKIVFVDITADWCFTCKANEKTVLETDVVSNAFKEKGVIAMKGDWTNRNARIADYLAKNGRYGIPFYAVYKPKEDTQVLPELLTKGLVLAALGE